MKETGTGKHVVTRRAARRGTGEAPAPLPRGGYREFDEAFKRMIAKGRIQPISWRRQRITA